jgi:hypothetical protein
MARQRREIIQLVEFRTEHVDQVCVFVRDKNFRQRMPLSRHLPGEMRDPILCTIFSYSKAALFMMAIKWVLKPTAYTRSLPLFIPIKNIRRQCSLIFVHLRWLGAQQPPRVAPAFPRCVENRKIPFQCTKIYSAAFESATVSLHCVRPIE